MTPESLNFVYVIAKESFKNAVVAVKVGDVKKIGVETSVLLVQNDGYIHKYSVASLCTAKTIDFKSNVFLIEVATL